MIKCKSRTLLYRSFCSSWSCYLCLRLCVLSSVYNSQYLWSSWLRSGRSAIASKYCVSFTSSWSLLRFKWALLKGLIVRPFCGFITKFLRNPVFRSEGYYGLWRIVDHVKDPWESLIWGQSALTTSGQFARYSDNSIILPSDCVTIQLTPKTFYRGRITEIGIDDRKGSKTKDKIVAIVQKLYRFTKLSKEQQNAILGSTQPICHQLLI